MDLSSSPSVFSPDVSLRELLRDGTAPRVSLFAPIARPWNRAKENRLRMSGLLRDAQTALQERGLSEPDATQLLQPAVDFVADDTSWQNGEEGLALFVARDHFSAHRLPFRMPAGQMVDRRFHVRPLLRALHPDGPFFLLSLSLGGVRLFRGARYSIEEVALENVPTTLDDALQYDEHIRSVTFHTGTQQGGGGTPQRRGAMYHGQEDAGDKAYVKEGIIRFFQALDNEVRRLLGREPTPPPLVLAGTESLRGLYRKVNHWPHLTVTDVERHFVNGDASEVDVNRLRNEAWSIVEPLYARERDEARQRYRHLAASEKGTGSIHATIPAAHDGRVDTLFVAEDAVVWGDYEPATRTVEVNTDPTPSDVELLNAAVAWTLDANGTVFVVGAEAVPSRTPIAAILRY